MLPYDCRNSQWHTERTILRRHLLSLLSSDSIKFHMIKDPLNVVLLTEPRMLHSVSHPLQTGIRFFQHPTPTRHQHALSKIPLIGAVSLPKGRRDWVSTFHIVDPLDGLGVLSTTVVSSRFAGWLYSSVQAR